MIEIWMKIYSKMTLNYRMIVERYPKSSGVIGNLIPNPKIFSILDEKISQVATHLLCSKKEIHMKIT